MASSSYGVVLNHRSEMLESKLANDDLYRKVRVFIQMLEYKLANDELQERELEERRLRKLELREIGRDSWWGWWWRWSGEREMLRLELEMLRLDRKEAIMRLEFSRKCRHPGSFVTISRICRFWESDGHNFDIKSLDPTKMTQETYDTLVDIIEFIEISRLHELFLLAIMLCFIAIQIFLGLMVESYDSKAKIQEIEAKIQDKFNYNGNCKVKIGIIPERSGTPFLKMGVLRPTPMSI